MLLGFKSRWMIPAACAAARASAVCTAYRSASARGTGPDPMYPSDGINLLPALTQGGQANAFAERHDGLRHWLATDIEHHAANAMHGNCGQFDI
jgi:hypothetical protein